ncbi:MAG: M28 family metallopeptidase [Candidatus Jordarchaeum sp.]|uniref:M28 family metallopeptidase n=1 Tax=Candidatus Jordarchaeum sp. TaxID=2823881 RepID=UPI00404B6E48
MIMIQKTLKNYMHNFIVDVCKEIGPRESGSKEEELAGNRIEEELKKFCNKTHQEEFTSSPTAFLGFIRYGSIMIVCGIFLYWLSVLTDLGWLQVGTNFFNLVLTSLGLTHGSFSGLIFSLIASVLAVFAVSYFILEVMRYRELVDFMFPKKKSKNIIGTINPSGKAKHTIIFAGHHDSAYEFNIFYYLKTVGGLTIFVGYVGVVIFSIVSVLKTIFYFLPFNLTPVFFWFGIFFLFLAPIAAIYIFFHSYKPVPGAFDNLSAVSVVLGIGKYLSENKDNPEIYPKNTRIHLISFSGEEAGLRGSKRYVKNHYEELKKSNTVLINMDGIAAKDCVVIIEKETLIGAKHNPEICNTLLKIAQEQGINARLGALPFGATDAAAFSRKKLPATTIGSHELKGRLPEFYHTRLDTPEVVDKEALGQVLQICLGYIKYIDNIR